MTVSKNVQKLFFEIGEKKTITLKILISKKKKKNVCGNT